MPDAVGAAGRPDAPVVGQDAVRRFEPDNKLVFGTAAIGRAIDLALLEVPEGHSVAVVAAVDNRGGAHNQRLVVAARIGAEWSIMGTLTHADRKPLEYGAAVRWSR